MMTRFKLPLTILLAFLLLGLTASNASALTADFGGVDGDTLKGATGSLTITETATEGTFNVEWYMNFAGYEGEEDDHQFLTEIAFKAFTNVTAVSLVGIDPMTAVSGDDIYPSNVNNGGCDPGSDANMVCVSLTEGIDATMGGDVTAYFSVTGDLKLDEWAYRGKFGPEDGWVISEGATPIPEPSAALVFAAGLVVASVRVRSQR
jgi:hypothetical protein